MNSESHNALSREKNSQQNMVGDVIERGITHSAVGMLSRFCRWFGVTPDSIKKFKPGVRPNSPPPTGGIAS